MKAQILNIADFSGGLNTKDADTLIADNECVDIENFEFDPVGNLLKRKGQQLYNNTALIDGLNGITRVYHLKKFYKSNGNTAFYAWGWSYALDKVILFKDGGAGSFSKVTIVDLASSYLADAYIWTTTIRDKLIFTNGSNLPYWGVNTGSFKRLGIIAPTAITSLTNIVDGGNMSDGVYQYKFTWKNSTDGVESASSAARSITLSLHGAIQSVDIVLPANSVDTNVNIMRIYRTKDGGTDYYLVAETADATTYTDTLADASLTTVYDNDVDDNQPPPDAPKFCCEHNNRLFLVGDSTLPYRLYFSKLGQPDYFPTNNYIDIGRMDVDVPKALIEFNQNLWIGSATGWRQVNTEGATTAWSVSDPYNGPGIYAERSVAICDAMQVPIGTDTEPGVIYGRRGVAAYLSFNGLVVAFDGYRFHLIGEKVQNTINVISESLLREAVGVYYPNKNQYQIAFNDYVVVVA